MFKHFRGASGIVVVVLALSLRGSLRAAEPAGGPPEFRTPAALAQPRGPLSDALMQSGMGDALRRARVGVAGYGEVGYTWNPDHDSGDEIFGRVFDNERGDHVQVDQLDLSVARAALRRRGQWDVGGKVELIYGYDTFRFHANGLNWYGDCLDDASTRSLLQFDLTQAYADVNVPVGTGLLVRVGKFVTPLGYETVQPATSPLYSHSYLFGFAKPFTHTGVLANYRPDEAARWSLWGGVVRGWDQALDDNNDAVSFLARVDYAPSEEWELRVGVIAGPEGDACDCDCPENNHVYRTVVDVVVGHDVSDRLRLAAEGLYGTDGAADANGNRADWYGAAGYATYVLDRRFTLNARLEFFHDGEGTRLETGEDLDLYSATVGVTATPFPQHAVLSRLKLRPEVRYDHASTPEFDGGTRDHQFTVGLDAVFLF
jgi:hypothetical protein